MRIAFVVSAFPVISETFILNQLSGLIDRGYDVDIYTLALQKLATPHAQISRYRMLERTRNLGRAELGLARRAARALKLLARPGARNIAATWATIVNIRTARDIGGQFSRLNLLEIGLAQLPDRPYDVVHCQFGKLGRRFVALKRAGLLSGKLITAFRGHDITQHVNAAPGFYDELFEQGDLFLPVSRSLERRLLDRGCDPAKVQVLHSGIECARFPFRIRAAAPGEAVNILTVGRFVEMKGISYGVEAVAGLIRAGRAVHYHIIGDGAMRGDIECRIRELHMEAHVTLHGWQNQDSVAGFVDRSHILLAPSVTAANGEAEGIPNVVKEAMAAGLPVVSTLHSGIPELVDDGVTGYLVPERDAASLTERLARLIDHPERWPAMGTAAREKIKQEFDSEALNDRLVSLYREVASR